MLNPTRFLLTEKEAGVGAGDIPALGRIRQAFERPRVEDVEGAVRRELAPLLATVRPGQRIAVTGSSRGISNFLGVIRCCVQALQAAGAEPFVIPGMGSHGGATAEGQVQVLADTHGIDAQSVGCPVEASMDVVQVGTTENGFPVYQDRLCHEADGVLVVNRVKPHTGITGVVESGLCKMLVIGMGKQAGASRIHQQSLRVDMGKMVRDAARIIVESDRPRLLGGIALVENAFKETAIVQGIAMQDYDALLEAESELLVRAYELLPRLPFEDLDALVVDEMGKNISGSGMDSNVIGRKPGLTSPRISAIFVRGLTEQTHGNATGLGYADLFLRERFDQVDLNATYMNAFTARRPLVGKTPMLVESELQAMQVLMSFRPDEDPRSLRLAWIKNTASLDEMWVSEALLQEVDAHPRLELLAPPAAVSFDDRGNLHAPALP
jgi:hypothetical protein